MGSEDISFLYLVESFPRLLLLQLESRMRAMEEFLENFGISKECMGSILLLFPPIIFSNIEVIRTRVLAFKEVCENRLWCFFILVYAKEYFIYMNSSIFFTTTF